MCRLHVSSSARPSTWRYIQRYTSSSAVFIVLKHSIVFVKYDTSLTEYVVLVYLSGDDLVEVKHVGGM